MPDKSDCPLLKSMLKVFSLLNFQFKFDKDEVTDVCIQCNRCNKTVTGQFPETVTIYSLPVFIKSFVFHNVGLSCMIETHYQYTFDVELEPKFPRI